MYKSERLINHSEKQRDWRINEFFASAGPVPLLLFVVSLFFVFFFFNSANSANILHLYPVPGQLDLDVDPHLNVK